jgi:hypothetical protein
MLGSTICRKLQELLKAVWSGTSWQAGLKLNVSKVLHAEGSRVPKNADEVAGSVPTISRSKIR